MGSLWKKWGDSFCLCPPPPAPAAEPQPAEPVQAEPEPAVQPEPAPEPEPQPEPEPEPQPEPQPEPEPQAAPEPPPVQQAAKEPEPSEAQTAVNMPRPPKRPKKKDEPRQDFASVLQTVQDLKQDPPPPKPEPEKKPEETKTSLADAVKQALNKSEQQAPRTPASRAETALNFSELDALRQQLAGCWNVPAGARNAEDLVIEVRVRVGPDRSVQTAELTDMSRAADPFWMAAAESALRAVLNPKCNPLKLPPDKYDVWQSIVITFNPREILG